MKQDLSNEQITQILRKTLQESVLYGSAKDEKVTFTLLEDNAVNMGVIKSQETKGLAGVVIADPSNDKVVVLEIQSVLEVVKFATPVLVASEMLLEADGSLTSFTKAEKIVLEAAEGLSKRLEGLGIYRPLKTKKKKEDAVYASRH